MHEDGDAEMVVSAAMVVTGIIGWRRAWTVSMISASSTPCR